MSKLGFSSIQLHLYRAKTQKQSSQDALYCEVKTNKNTATILFCYIFSANTNRCESGRTILSRLSLSLKCH